MYMPRLIILIKLSYKNPHCTHLLLYYTKHTNISITSKDQLQKNEERGKKRKKKYEKE